MTIDWGAELDRVEQATKPMAEGPHTFRIVDAKPVTASTGNKMIKLTCKVEGGPDDGKLGYNNIVFTFDNPRALKMTLRRLRALGIDADLLRGEKPSIEQIAGKLMGRSAEGNVTHRQWNGETQDDIDFGAAGSGTPVIPAAPVVGGPAPVVAPAPTKEAAAPPAPVIPTEPTTPVAQSEESF
jgi:hypothetical protein